MKWSVLVFWAPWGTSQHHVAPVRAIHGHLSQAWADITSQFIEHKSNNAFHFISSRRPLSGARANRPRFALLGCQYEHLKAFLKCKHPGCESANNTSAELWRTGFARRSQFSVSARADVKQAVGRRGCKRTKHSHVCNDPLLCMSVDKFSAQSSNSDCLRSLWTIARLAQQSSSQIFSWCGRSCGTDQPHTCVPVEDNYTNLNPLFRVVQSDESYKL